MTFNESIKKCGNKGENNTFAVTKSDGEKQYVFGWASVAVRADGEEIIDYQEDIIPPEELEKAAYNFVLSGGVAGENHEKTGVGRLIESVVFTEEKAIAMGFSAGLMPVGWWVGFHITDSQVWEKFKSGEYKMFSIGGRGVREDLGD